jgi:hypothetical protein
MITVAAIPNSKHTAWTVASFHDGSGTVFHHLTESMERAKAERLAAQVREILGLKPPKKNGNFDYSESPCTANQTTATTYERALSKNPGYPAGASPQNVDGESKPKRKSFRDADEREGNDLKEPE